MLLACWRIAILTVAPMLVLLDRAAAKGADYPNAEAALRDGVQKVQQKKYDEARPALEAALKLAGDDEFRLRVYPPLVVVYRQLPESEPMIQAQEFIIKNSERSVERSQTARSLASFLYQRGLLDKQIQGYEQRLKDNADDIVALSVLVAAYGAKRDEGRKGEVAAKLVKLEQARSAKLADEFEKQAVAQPQKATWHWKEAAVAWRDAGRKEQALAAAEKAVHSGVLPEGLLLHYYYRHLGEVYADCNQSQKGIDYLEKAIAATAIQGYKDDCQKRIDQVRAQIRP